MNEYKRKVTIVAIIMTLIFSALVITFQLIKDKENKSNVETDEQVISTITQDGLGHYYTEKTTRSHHPECDHKDHKK